MQEGSKASQLKRYASAVLGSGNLKQAVILPEGEDLDEWLAVNSTLSLPFPSRGGQGRLQWDCWLPGWLFVDCHAWF